MDPLRCKCKLSDCAYFTPVPNEPLKTDCKHPDKKYYLQNTTCPLYKKEWVNEQQTAKAAEIRAKLLAKRKKL